MKTVSQQGKDFTTTEEKKHPSMTAAKAVLFATSPVRYQSKKKVVLFLDMR